MKVRAHALTCTYEGYWELAEFQLNDANESSIFSRLWIIVPDRRAVRDVYLSVCNLMPRERLIFRETRWRMGVGYRVFNYAEEKKNAVKVGKKTFFCPSRY